MSSERSPAVVAFYQKLLGLEIIERSPFKSVGAWLAAVQVQLTLYPPGSFRTPQHRWRRLPFAFRTDDFDGALATLIANGFHEHAAEDDPMRVMVRRTQQWRLLAPTRFRDESSFPVARLLLVFLVMKGCIAGG